MAVHRDKCGKWFEWLEPSPFNFRPSAPDRWWHLFPAAQNTLRTKKSATCGSPSVESTREIHRVLTTQVVKLPLGDVHWRLHPFVHDQFHCVSRHLLAKTSPSATHSESTALGCLARNVDHGRCLKWPCEGRRIEGFQKHWGKSKTTYVKHCVILDDTPLRQLAG